MPTFSFLRKYLAHLRTGQLRNSLILRDVGANLAVAQIATGSMPIAIAMPAAVFDV